MRKHKASFGKRPFRKNLLLSVVALVEILLLLMVSTYAWVETVSTIRIYTSESADSKQPATPTGQFLSHLFQKTTIDTSSSSAIDLSKIYHESGAFHLSPASSSDGKTIFFPHIRGNGATTPTNITNDFRKADSSDNMVNYVSFSFKVAAKGKYVFDANPTFSFADDTNLVRLSLQVGNGTPKIFSKTAYTGNVVYTISGGTSGTTVNAFSSFVSGAAATPALDVSENDQIVTVRIWIQDPTHTYSSTYSGKQLTISNLKLVPAYAVRTRVSVNGSVASNTSVGKVGLGASSSPTASTYSVIKYFKAGSTAYMNSAIVDSTNYSFCGWSTTVNNTSPSPTTNTNSYTVVAQSNPDTITEYYAIFLSGYTVTAYSYQGKTGSTASTATAGGTVKVGNGTASYTSATGSVRHGSSIELTASAYSGWGFVGWYSSSTATTAESTSATYTISNVTANKTYYARFARVTVSLKTVVGASSTTVSTAAGTVKIGNGTAGTNLSSTVAYNSSVTFYVESTNSGYSFMGWYSGTTLKSSATSWTTPALTENTTYYARFEQVPWQLKGDFNSWDGTTMVREQENVYSVTVDLAEGNNPYKVYNTDGTWYGESNENVYEYGFGTNGQSTSFTKLENHQFTSNDSKNANFVTHAGKYKFTFYSDTKQVCIDFVSYNNITITLDYNNYPDWGYSACKFYCEAASNSVNVLMIKNSTAKKYTYTLSSSYGNYSDNVHFSRGSGTTLSNFSFWHDCHAKKRGYSTTYKITSSSSYEVGYWD